MNKKQKEEVKKAFREKRRNTVIMVNENGCSIPVDEYIEQESWRRKDVLDKDEELMYTTV